MSAIAFNGEIFPSGARAASDQIYDNSNTGLPANVQGAIDKTTGNISSLDTVELTATAAHAHAAGSTFLWIGQLVKVTTAIAVGDTIALGTNVTNTDICSILDELNSKLASNKIGVNVDLSPYTSSGNFYKFPSDGYVLISNRASTSGVLKVFILGSDGTNGPLISIEGDAIPDKYSSVFVKKGMLGYILVNTLNSTKMCIYRPVV